MRRLRLYITRHEKEPDSDYYICNVQTCGGTTHGVIIEPYYYSAWWYGPSRHHIRDNMRDVYYSMYENYLIMPENGRLTIVNRFLEYRKDSIRIDMRHCKI